MLSVQYLNFMLYCIYNDINNNVLITVIGLIMIKMDICEVQKEASCR